MFRLRQRPRTLVELGESLKLLETLQGDLAKTEAQIPLIHDQFAFLDKYEVSVKQAVSTLLINREIHSKHDTGLYIHKHQYCSMTVYVSLCINNILYLLQ